MPTEKLFDLYFGRPFFPREIEAVCTDITAAFQLSFSNFVVARRDDTFWASDANGDLESVPEPTTTLMTSTTTQTTMLTTTTTQDPNLKFTTVKQAPIATPSSASLVEISQLLFGFIILFI